MYSLQDQLIVLMDIGGTTGCSYRTTKAHPNVK